MRDFIKDKLVLNLIWIVIVLFLCSWLAAKCSNEYISKKNTDSYKTVSTKKQALQEIPMPETIVKQFTKIKTITKYVDRIKVDTIEVRYKDSVSCVFERSGIVETKEYSMHYHSNQNGFKVTDLSLVDTVFVVNGTKRKWFLGKETNEVTVSHSNKHITTSEVQLVEVKPKKKFYDTNLFKFGIGVVAGVIIMK